VEQVLQILKDEFKLAMMLSGMLAMHGNTKPLICS